MTQKSKTRFIHTVKQAIKTITTHKKMSVVIVLLLFLCSSMFGINGMINMTYGFIDTDKYITVGNYKNLEYKKDAKKDIETIKSELWTTVLDSSKIKKYPEIKVNEEKKKIIREYKEIAKNDNKLWEDFLKEDIGMPQKEFEKQITKTAKSIVKEKLVINYIADKENLNISLLQYIKDTKKTLHETGMTKKEFKKEYGQNIYIYAIKNDFYSQFLIDKVLDNIYDNATPK